MTTAIGDYNARLFRRGLYGGHHSARFGWLEASVRRLGIRRAKVIELGCFDGRSIDHLPLEIERYVGLDAGWESGTHDGIACGLDAAQQHYVGDSRFSFIRSTDPADIENLEGSFDLGICLETFEHIQPALVNDYVAALAGKLSGPLLVTVPNEKGLAVLLKTVGAKVMRVDRGIQYAHGELLNSVLGRMDRVARHDHKGFDYSALAQQIHRHFRQVTIAGIGPAILPGRTRLTIGILALP